MTLLSLCLAVAAAVSAQTAPAPTLSVFEHTAKKATLVLVTPAGESRPQALYYQGPKGRWLVLDRQLYDLGRDDGWAQIRYDIYSLQKDGLDYAEDSDVRPSRRLWTDPDAVAAVEAVIAELAAKGAKEAPLSCLTRTDAAQRQASRAAVARAGLSTAEKLGQDAVLDPQGLEALKPVVREAQAAGKRSKSLCEGAVSAAFQGQPAETVAPMFYEAEVSAERAETLARQANDELDRLRIVEY